MNNEYDTNLSSISLKRGLAIDIIVPRDIYFLLTEDHGSETNFSVVKS